MTNRESLESLAGKVAREISLTNPTVSVTVSLVRGVEKVTLTLRPDADDPRVQKLPLAFDDEPHAKRAERNARASAAESSKETRTSGRAGRTRAPRPGIVCESRNGIVGGLQCGKPAKRSEHGPAVCEIHEGKGK